MKSVPNILSIFRICLVPLFIVAYILDGNELKIYAISIFIIANLSDVIDGYIARRFDAQTNLGKILDPLGDKLINFSALICITVTIAKPIFIGAVCIFFVKEVLMGIGGLIIRKKAHVALPHANWLGKTATVAMFLVCVLLLVWRDVPEVLATVLVSAAISLTLAAFFKYLHTYIVIMKKQTSASGTPEAEEIMEN